MPCFGHIFAGLGQLEVSAVGHVTASLTGTVLGTFLIRQRDRSGARVIGLRFSILGVETRPAADKLSSLNASPGSRVWPPG